MVAPRYTELVQKLPATVPFVGPESQERSSGMPFRARIGANENVFGPSPAAVEAMRAAASEAWKYADPENHDLKLALADLHGVSPENIVIGEGIDGLLGYLARMLITEGTPVVTSLGAYPTFNFHVEGFGGVLHTVPYRDDAEDPEALLDRTAACNAPLVYIANPDNPMGTWHDAETIQHMIDRIPSDTLLCLDEAYIEFAPPGTAPPLDVTDTRVIRFRTFSKAYGMAGARIGYGIAHRGLVSAFNKVRNHFGVNRMAQAGALAALSDRTHLDHVLGAVAESKRRIVGIARAGGLEVLPSAANFVAIDCGREGDYARRILQALVSARVFVRMPFVAPQDRCIRVSAGTAADLDAFEEVLPRAIAQSG